MVVVCQHTNYLFLCLQTFLGTKFKYIIVMVVLCINFVRSVTVAQVYYVCPITCTTVPYDSYSLVLQVQCTVISIVWKYSTFQHLKYAVHVMQKVMYIYTPVCIRKATYCTVIDHVHTTSRTSSFYD